MDIQDDGEANYACLWLGAESSQLSLNAYCIV